MLARGGEKQAQHKNELNQAHSVVLAERIKNDNQLRIKNQMLFLIKNNINGKT